MTAASSDVTANPNAAKPAIDCNADNMHMMPSSEPKSDDQHHAIGPSTVSMSGPLPPLSHHPSQDCASSETRVTGSHSREVDEREALHSKPNGEAETVLTLAPIKTIPAATTNDTPLRNADVVMQNEARATDKAFLTIHTSSADAIIPSKSITAESTSGQSLPSIHEALSFGSLLPSSANSPCTALSSPTDLSRRLSYTNPHSDQRPDYPVPANPLSSSSSGTRIQNSPYLHISSLPIANASQPGLVRSHSAILPSIHSPTGLSRQSQSRGSICGLPPSASFAASYDITSTAAAAGHSPKSTSAPSSASTICPPPLQAWSGAQGRSDTQLQCHPQDSAQHQARHQGQAQIQISPTNTKCPNLPSSAHPRASKNTSESKVLARVSRQSSPTSFKHHFESARPHHNHEQVSRSSTQESERVHSQRLSHVFNPPRQNEGLDNDKGNINGWNSLTGPAVLQDERTNENRKAAARDSVPSRAAYGEAVKQYLDIFDIETSLNEIADGSGRALDFSRHYSLQANQSQRTGLVSGSIPSLSECDSILQHQHRVMESLARLKDVLSHHHHHYYHRNHQTSHQSEIEHERQKDDQQSQEQESSYGFSSRRESVQDYAQVAARPLNYPQRLCTPNGARQTLRAGPGSPRRVEGSRISTPTTASPININGKPSDHHLSSQQHKTLQQPQENFQASHEQPHEIATTHSETRPHSHTFPPQQHSSANAASYSQSQSSLHADNDHDMNDPSSTTPSMTHPSSYNDHSYGQGHTRAYGYQPSSLSDSKKRKGRAAPPGRCHSCNRAETPEWRRGPDGARTLCNACGLHYAKLTRKMGGTAAKGASATASAIRSRDMSHSP